MEWVDRANNKHVSVNDFVLKVAAEEIIVGLSSIPGHPEDYTDFIFSDGFTARSKDMH